MVKRLFSFEEVKVVAFSTPAKTLKLQLYQWKRSGKIATLRRGLYYFPDTPPLLEEIVRTLYAPAYISLEYALNAYGLIPDVPFAVTLVTPKAGRTFETVLGRFLYQTIKKEAFLGYDPKTLWGRKEKALVDTLYLKLARLDPNQEVASLLRLQNLGEINFRKALALAKYFGSKKLKQVLLRLKKDASPR